MNNNNKWASVHGLGGAAFLVTALVELGQFVRHEAPSPRTLDVFVATSCLFVLGLTAKGFRRRWRHLGNKQSFFFRAASWNIAFAGLMMSPYCCSTLMAMPTGDQPRPPFLSQRHLVGLVLWVLGTVSAAASGVHEVLYGAILAPGFFISMLTSNFILLGMPVAHWCLGIRQLQFVAETYNLANSTYGAALLSSFVLAWDTFLLGMITSGHVQYSDIRPLLAFSWAGLYSGGLSMLLGYLHRSYAVSATVYATILFLYALSMGVKQLVLLERGITKYSEKDCAVPCPPAQHHAYGTRGVKQQRRAACPEPHPARP